MVTRRPIAATRSAASETFRSLHVRNFRLFFVGQLISQVGNWLTLVTQALFVFELTNSGVDLGILSAAQFGPVLILGPWAGLVADRSDKRRLLLTVQVIAMAQSGLLAALAFSGSPPVGLVYVVAAIGGVTVAFDNPARRAFVVEMVADRDVNNAVSLNSALMTSSRVIGPALAGLVIRLFGFGWCFAGDAVSYVAVIAALSAMRPGELRRPPVAERGRGQIREGLRYAWGVTALRAPLLMMAVVGTFSYNFQTVFPVFAKRVLHGTDTTFTLLFSVISVGALAGALATARRTTISVRTVATTAFAYGAAMAVMAVAPNQPFAFVTGVGLGVCSIAFLTASTAIVQIEAAPRMRGRVLALQAMLFLGSTPIGGPIVGWVSERWGARWAVALGAVAAMAAGAWGMRQARRAGEEPEAGDVGLEVPEPGLV
jgi:MFS family permease